MSNNHEHFYINGTWVKPLVAKTLDVINPATGEMIGQTPLTTAAEVDAAVETAATAFRAWRRTPCGRGVKPEAILRCSPRRREV